MNWLIGFLPTALIVLFLAYAFVQHEVAEWAYERAQGLQESSASFGLLVDATAAIGSVGLYVLLIVYGFDQGWPSAVGLYAATLWIGFADQIVPILIKRISTKAFLLFRLTCLGAFYIILIYICYYLGWFGLLRHRVLCK
jgi:hypothetical protein